MRTTHTPNNRFHGVATLKENDHNLPTEAPRRLKKVPFLTIVSVLTAACVYITVVGVRRLLFEHYYGQFQGIATKQTRELESTILEGDILGATRTAGLGIDEVKTAILDPDKVDDPALLKKLTWLQKHYDVSIVYVMNAKGDVVACTPYDEGKTLTGNNYSFRPYLKEAMKGKDNVYPAVGVTTFERGLYYASPVYDRQQQKILGAVVMKKGLERVDGFLLEVSGPVALITADGLVFATNMSEWMFQADKVVTDESKPPVEMGLHPFPWDIENNTVLFGKRQHGMVAVPMALHDERGRWHLVFLHSTEDWYSGWILLFSAAPVVLAFMFISQFILHYDRRRAVEWEKQRLRQEGARILRLSEAKYKDLIERTDTGYVILDKVGRVIEANNEYLRLTGYENSSAIHGHRITEWTADHDVDQSEQMIETCLKENQVRNLELDYVDTEGKTTPVEINASLIETDHSSRIVAICRDITERKKVERALRENEERWRLFTQHIPTAIQGCYDDGTVFYWNRASENLYGYLEKEALDNDLSELVIPDEHRRVFLDGLANARESDRSGEFMPPVELEFRKKDGELVHVYCINTAVCVPGAPLLFFMQLDLRDQKRAEELEESVRLRTAELQAVNNELEAFCYSVSHDLRAPLRGIDGFSLAVLEDNRDNLDETSIEYLSRVRKGAQKMSTLIDDLLGLSRLTRKEMTMQEANLSRLAEDIIQQLRVANPNREVATKIEPGVIAPRADEALIQNVLQNLLSNAWKFTGKSDNATIEFGKREADGQTVYYVHDNGAGFDMKYADNLFGAFQRLHNREQFEGSGIGLASAKRIIQRHGGRIWAESTVNEGATFYFTLS